jgi:hypothetical protein
MTRTTSRGRWRRSGRRWTQRLRFGENDPGSWTGGTVDGRERDMWRVLLLLGLLSACKPSPPPEDMSAPPNPAAWFPADYDASRHRFREDCPKFVASAEDFCRSWTVPSKTDPDLTIDYGFFSHGGDRLLVLQSGIHGPEGESGAAAQFYFMATYLQALRDKGIDILIIHAMNPWGYKHVRRNDETNTNLNRNFSVDGSDYKFDNASYRRFRSVFEPQGPVGSVFWGSARGSWGFLTGFIGSGFSSGPLNDGLNNGQYEFAEGINYGGHSPRPQQEFLRQMIGPILARPYRKTLYLDFHTGLGQDGVLSVILGKKPASGPRQDLQKLLGAYQPQGIEITDPSTTPGFFADFGDVIDFVPSLSSHPDTFIAVTMEYGTMGLDPINELRSANRMILDGEKYNFGCAAPAVCDEIDTNTREMFNPSDPVWRHKVLREADLVFRTLRDQF